MLFYQDGWNMWCYRFVCFKCISLRLMSRGMSVISLLQGNIIDTINVDGEGLGVYISEFFIFDNTVAFM